ncbi:MAG: hypothetical protein AAB573_03265 [Patescibacteria group bacterium]
MTRPLSPEIKRVRAEARAAFRHFNRPGSLTRIFSDRHGGRISDEDFHRQLEKSPEAKRVLDTFQRAGEKMQSDPELRAAMQRMHDDDDRILNGRKPKRRKK